jgi:hypothetical protein
MTGQKPSESNEGGREITLEGAMRKSRYRTSERPKV